jgi:L,D-peptidoglycan transpeptidase YkuD (ErfK/YbiS/YcfS/YnhG family)
MFSRIQIRARAGYRQRGWLIVGGRAILVALGRTGIRADKRESDGATPRGVFHPLRVWWRQDRGPPPRTVLPVRRIGPADGWCEDPHDRRYNRPIRLSPGGGGDRLVRDDNLYDVIMEIDHNTRPRIAGRGSAVFIHVARPGFGPTAGCVALRAGDLRRLLARVTRRTKIDIQ